MPASFASFVRYCFHVAPHDRLHRGVGFECRRVDADRLALQQLLLEGDFQHEGEHLLDQLLRHPLADHGQTRVFGRRLRRLQAEEGPQRQAVAAAPRDAALRVEALEVADEQHAEEHARRDRGAAAVAVERLAQPLHVGVELGLGEQLVQSRIEGVAGRARQRARWHHQLLLELITTSTEGHATLLRTRRRQWLVGVALFQRAASSRTEVAQSSYLNDSETRAR